MKHWFLPLSILFFMIHHGQSQDGADNQKKQLFVKGSPNASEATEVELGVLLEYFIVDHRTANRLVREHAPKAADAAQLRDELEALLDSNEAELLETVWLLARSGQRAKTESITEVIYPTEYDPPEIPNTFGGGAPVQAKDSKDQARADLQAVSTLSTVGSEIPITAATPTAFETRNTGVTLEVDPVLSSDNKFVDLNLAPEIVAHIDDIYFTREGREDSARGVDHIQMPLFYTMKTTTQMTAVPGNYNLIGIHTPNEDKTKRILALLRCDLIPVK
ncbi:MAG: hypothetical protein CMO55_26065 [Verrucomicrobiales bacterium]|nr:hypothetical protein [Verrucomicrobiales bacterium]